METIYILVAICAFARLISPPFEKSDMEKRVAQAKYAQDNIHLMSPDDNWP